MNKNRKKLFGKIYAALPRPEDSMRERLKDKVVGTVYIIAGNDFFKISNNEENKLIMKIPDWEKIMEEGADVEFMTPTKQTGKSRWAYDIVPVK